MTQSAPPPPRPLSYASGGVDIAAVAKRQRAVILCILSYLVLVVLQFFVPPSLRLVLGLLGLAVSITGAVFVFMLAMTIYSTGVGIVLGILTLIPLVGLIVLLVINGKATNILRANGIQVGLLGARGDQIPS